MSEEGWALGKALAEANGRRGTVRCENVRYRFEVSAPSLDKLGEEASRKAFAFYGDHAWRITGMFVIDSFETIYKAEVETEIA